MLTDTIRKKVYPFLEGQLTQLERGVSFAKVAADKTMWNDYFQPIEYNIYLLKENRNN